MNKQLNLPTFAKNSYDVFSLCWGFDVEFYHSIQSARSRQSGVDCMWSIRNALNIVTIIFHVHRYKPLIPLPTYNKHKAGGCGLVDFI